MSTESVAYERVLAAIEVLELCPDEHRDITNPALELLREIADELWDLVPSEEKP